jgi:N-acyl-D-aspartate/D-glutamate deacylase
MTNPVVREVAALPLDRQVAALTDPAFRERVLAAATGERADGKLGGRLIGAFDRMYELGDPPDYEPDPATSIARRAERQGRDPLDLAYDHMVSDGGRAFFYVPILNYVDGDLDAAGEMLAHPHTVPGLADGGAHVGTICDASFPTTLLTLWGRDRDHGRFDLPYLVRQHTRDTARTVGLLDRGVLAPGYRADVNVIDFDRLTARRPEMRHDLPAGGRRLVQAAEGYVATVVAGQVTYEEGRPTEALPGRLLRGPRPVPTPGGPR